MIDAVPSDAPFDASSETQAESPSNTDEADVARFSKLAFEWWDPQGSFRLLHRLNPIRCAFVAERIDLDGASVADIGCGGGLLSEALALRGARVLGIDASSETIAVAEDHLERTSTAIDGSISLAYRTGTAEDLAGERPGAFDLVTCMELIEHVPDPESLVHACATLVRPGGRVIFSTINRNPKSWLLAVLMAEYVLGMLPKGTHDYARFVRPSELARWGRACGLMAEKIDGISWSPVKGGFGRSRDSSINYLISFIAGRPRRSSLGDSL
ncbi:bifunctional 2-polyprenyl-6-hydroxyphenol methylase/3-demethylubiquinol 3-O-methyltransferase UbiG [Thioalkalivibrio sp. HK1]|uniref:bifunctional 2-polyprenyl-6-hydroxyphenol methylase/3-demethylubiquinol 3-O-methyltransferase UbiG n=1 Tax=Thioalkalivibrio sp. HK1 TaxID=1469245 RepID=UPI0004B5AE13|nr:bifunctional 2-polyprenyl-6-hydroxyphenol methylase/3-demethylubiquinol 3-O-methyltransferase UbiG [Thioalkalivibrio sp. HK1]